MPFVTFNGDQLKGVGAPTDAGDAVAMDGPASFSAPFDVHTPGIRAIEVLEDVSGHCGPYSWDPGLNLLQSIEGHAPGLHFNTDGSGWCGFDAIRSLHWDNNGDLEVPGAHFRADGSGNVGALTWGADGAVTGGVNGGTGGGPVALGDLTNVTITGTPTINQALRWSSAGGGQWVNGVTGVTSITAGPGLFTTPNPITGSGTLSLASTVTQNMTFSGHVTLGAQVDVNAGPMLLHGNRISGIGDPANPQEAATKHYVDQVAMGNVGVHVTEFHEILEHPIEVDVEHYLDEYEDQLQEEMAIDIDIHDAIRWQELHDLINDGFTENDVLEVQMTPVDFTAVGGSYMPTTKVEMYSLAGVTSTNDMPTPLYREQDMFLRIFGEKLRQLEDIEWPLPTNPLICAWVHLGENDHRVMLYIDTESIRHVEEECDIPLAAIMSFQISSIKIVKR